MAPRAAISPLSCSRDDPSVPGSGRSSGAGWSSGATESALPARTAMAADACSAGPAVGASDNTGAMGAAGPTAAMAAAAAGPAPLGPGPGTPGTGDGIVVAGVVVVGGAVVDGAADGTSVVVGVMSRTSGSPGRSGVTGSRPSPPSSEPSFGTSVLVTPGATGAPMRVPVVGSAAGAAVSRPARVESRWSIAAPDHDIVVNAATTEASPTNPTRRRKAIVRGSDFRVGVSSMAGGGWRGWNCQLPKRGSSERQ